MKFQDLRNKPPIKTHLERSEVQNELVGALALAAPVEHRVAVLDPLGHVVRVQNGHASALLQTLLAWVEKDSVSRERKVFKN